MSTKRKSTDTDDDGRMICLLCNENFSSRNKLFKHIPNCSRNAGTTAENEVVGASYDLSDKYIYVTGGRCRGRTLGSVERFSLHRGIWETCPRMLENRGSHGAAGCGSRLFAFGGGGFDNNLATCEELVDGAWKPIAPMKTFRHALTVTEAVVDSLFFATKQTAILPVSEQHLNTPRVPLVFCIGGWIDGKECSAHVEAYDVVSDTWHDCAPLICPRKLHGAASVGHELYVFGGNGNDTQLWHTAAVESYDLSTNAWTRRRDLPSTGPCSAIAIGDVVYVLMHGKRMYRYDRHGDSYHPLAPLPLKEWFTFDVTTCGTCIYVHGGASEGVWSKAFFAYDTRTDVWTKMPDMSQQRRRCAAAIVTVTAAPMSTVVLTA